MWKSSHIVIPEVQWSGGDDKLKDDYILDDGADYFDLFWPKNMIHKIANMSNLYAYQLNESGEQMEAMVGTT